MADYSGTLIPAFADPLSEVFNGDYYGNAISLDAQVPIYRGRVGAEYVYAIGSIPIGATDVIIVGYS